MPRNFLRGLLICLIPILAAAFLAVRLDRYRLGIDLAGGTILVYEVNLERTRQLEAERRPGDAPTATTQGLTNEQMRALAGQIKRRIDPADLKNVTVRPLGNTRIEIILPTGGAAGSRSNLTEEEIAEVKRLVSQMGVLEFRILANEADDEAGIREARTLIDTSEGEVLEQWAIAGAPPAPPSQEFEVKAAAETPVKVRYAWVELSAEERESLGLNNAAAATSALWLQLASTRAADAKERTVTHRYSNEGRAASMLLYSREVENAEWLAKEQADAELLKKEGKEAEFNPKKYEYFVLTRVSPLDRLRVEGEISLTAQSDTDPKTFSPAVSFRFNGAGAQAFGKMTERNKPSGNTIRTLAILLDQRVVSAPTLNAVITSNGQISGRFDRQSVDRLVNFLRHGALNAQLREKPVSEATIGPTLGADTIRKGTISVALAFAAVLVFMLIYYRFAGIVACIALLANLLLTIGFMVAVNAAFTLPGLAGLVLMLGMAVDANVLIYERLREERNKGANLATAIRNGYDRAFLTIIDTHLTSIFTAIVLFMFGNDQLKGFAISLSVGLIISLFTSLYMTRLIFDYWLHRKWLTELRMMRLFERPNFNPMKFRYYFFSLTGALTIVGLGLFLYRGEQLLNVDFRGGTVYAGQLKPGNELALSSTEDEPGLRELLAEDRQERLLQVESARWINRPATGDIGAVGVYDFEITYASDQQTTTVSLTQNPAPAVFGEVSDEKVIAMQDALKERARKLPDISVEQMFIGERPPGGKSAYFTIRTTERQPDLVRASLDRLLRKDNGEPLVASTDMSFATRTETRDGKEATVADITGSIVELKFDRPMSPSLLREVLDREFNRANASAGTTPFKLEGVGEAENGRFRTMMLDVSQNGMLGAIRQKAEADAAAAASAAGMSVRAAVASIPAVITAPVPIAQPDPAAFEGQVRALQSILVQTEQSIESRPEPLRLEVFDSQLATETQTKALGAILISWIAIILYLWFRFGNWTFGLAAVLCLFHDLCFTLGAIALCHYLHLIPAFSRLGIQDFKIDLAAVAALLTLVGYSVNEIIVNFARIREVRGKNPALTPSMINDSVNQTLSRTILTSTTVFLVSFVLYAFGGEGVHLFAFVMVMGVLVSTYSAIFVASPLLLFLGEGRSVEPVETPKVEEVNVAEIEG
jgi:SecD/SecF fusion protein